MSVAVLTAEELEALVERAVRRALALAAGREGLSSGDAARIARRSPKTIRRWVASGRLRASRRDRQIVIQRAELEAFLAGQAEGTPAVTIVRSLKK
jgi:hypothetical protein